MRLADGMCRVITDFELIDNDTEDLDERPAAISESKSSADQQDKARTLYLCSHCGADILLNDRTTFYKCFMHSCSGKFSMPDVRILPHH